jgi:hypothetical protein
MILSTSVSFIMALCFTEKGRLSWAKLRIIPWNQAHRFHPINPLAAPSSLLLLNG